MEQIIQSVTSNGEYYGIGAFIGMLFFWFLSVLLKGNTLLAEKVLTYSQEDKDRARGRVADILDFQKEELNRIDSTLNRVNTNIISIIDMSNKTRNRMGECEQNIHCSLCEWRKK